MSKKQNPFSFDESLKKAMAEYTKEIMKEDEKGAASIKAMAAQLAESNAKEDHG